MGTALKGGSDGKMEGSLSFARPREGLRPYSNRTASMGDRAIYLTQPAQDVVVWVSEEGLGSYKTAWLILHKLRQAMVRPGREGLRGVVEVDETYWGAAESGGATGRLVYSKALIVVAAEQDGKGIGRIRMARIPDFDRATLHGFIRSSVEPGRTVCTDGLNSYREMKGSIHHRHVQHRLKDGEHLLPRVHRAVSLLKRWMLGTHQGAIGYQHLEDYLNEFVFRFNRRRSASRGKLFFRLAQHALQIAPTTYERLVRPQDVE